MKKIINTSLMMALIPVFILSFTACSKDDDKQSAPQITLNEANIEGDILCVQADVMAMGRTAAILLTITGKDGNVKAPASITCWFSSS